MASFETDLARGSVLGNEVSLDYFAHLKLIDPEGRMKDPLVKTPGPGRVRKLEEGLGVLRESSFVGEL